MCRVQNLRMGFERRLIQEKITFEVKRGEIFTIMGGSGSGKSTLLRHMIGLQEPQAGHVFYGGHDYWNTAPQQQDAIRRRFGVLFQGGALFSAMTLFQNVALPLRVRGKAEQTYRQDVIELLKWVGLGERINVLPPVLSGGEKQRVAIARALIDRPEILLADEPTGNVDPPMARRLLSLFLELNRLGTAVVIATHDLALMDQVDARRMILTDGRLDIYE